MVGKEYKKRIKERKQEAKKSINSAPIIGALVVLALGFLIVRVFFGVQAHFKSYVYYTQPVMPCSLQSPLARRLHTEMESLSVFVEDGGQVLTDEQVIENSNNPVILRGVYMLESTKGQNDGCREDDLFNGFGYRQNSSEFRCYKDFRSVAQKVDDWYTTRLEENGNNVAEALCYYNRGVVGLHTCEYSQNFLNVLGDNL